MGKDTRQKIELPKRPFLYTVDQLCSLLQMTRPGLNKYLWYRGRSTYARDKHHMVAVNIARPDEQPDWRVDEQELTRWLRYKGFRVM